MKTKQIISLLFLWLLAACQGATSSAPVTTTVDTEFSLVPGQTAIISDADLTITFNSILSDERCPTDVECVASGPVTISLAIQQGEDTPANITLETLTDTSGRSPEGSFEGINSQVETGNYFVRVVGVLPYPKNLSGIKVSDYEVTLLVIHE